MKKQFLSILLALVMVISIIPINTFAGDSSSGNFTTESYGDFIDGEQVLRDMIEKNGLYAHPRIIMSNEKFAKLKASIGDDSVTAILLEKLRAEADRVMTRPVAGYEIPDGIRLLETSKRIQRRVAALAMAYNIFGDEKYAQRCYAELEAACNFQDWNPSHFLDTAEMSTAFALGYDWLYHWMNDEQRAFLRKNMIEKGLNQVMEDYEDKPRKRTYRWYQDYPGDNWKLVCNGSMSLAALSIGDEAEARDIASEVLTYAYKESYAFVRRAYSAKDGTYSEGLGYWDYATYYLGLYSSALTSAAGTDYGLADHEGLRKSVDFVRYMSSNTPKSFSFGDDRESRDTGWAVLLWLAEYYQSYDIASTRLKKIENDSFNYLDLLWIDEEKTPDSASDSPTDWGEVGASNASFRNTWEESGIVTALHAGVNNYKYHGHYDLGSFYLESNGARFFTDLGNENYELENRLYSYRIRAEGHNTLVINPSQELDQQEGAECLITQFAGGNEAYAVTDLTAAYEPSGAESVIRGLKMIKDKECVIIQDEISLDAPGEIYWFAHTKGEIALADDGRSAVVTVGSEKMWVGLISDGGTFTVMNAELLPTSLPVPNQTDNSEYRKLAVHLTNTKDTTISVACIPLKAGETHPSWTPSVKAISEWTPQTIVGDVNADGEFTVADVVALQKWLLAVPNVKLANWKAGDLCEDGRLDVFDLCLMKRELLSETPKNYVDVTTIDELFVAMRNAQPGDVIRVASGTYDYTTYQGAQKIDTSAEGTEDAPITLTAADPENPPIITGTSAENGYVIQIKGDYWILENLKITTSQKGIVLDNSNHSIIRNCEVYNIGSEAIAIRDGSSYCTVKDSYIHDTGTVTSGYGEGVYIGSAKSVTGFDYKCDYNTVDGCTFKNIAAEHVDVKEYTTGTEIMNCTFYGDGMTGANYAGSFVDIAGNDVNVHDNIGYRNGNTNIVAAFELHEQVEGWGYHCIFTDNTVYMDQPYGAVDTSRRMYVVDGWYSDFSVRNNQVDYGNGLVPADSWEYYNSDYVTYLN